MITMRGIRFSIGLLLPLLSIAPSRAQVLAGIPPLNSMAGGPDSLNLGNLNDHWDIPIINKPGRGENFTHDLTYDSSVWYPIDSNGTWMWEPVAGYGWGGLLQTPSTYIGYSVSTSQGTCGQYGQYQWQSWTYDNIFYRDPYGATHELGGDVSYITATGTQACPPSGTQPSLPMTFPSNDGSGYSVTISSVGENTISMVVQNSAGTTVVAPVVANPPPTQGGYTLTDRNGNEYQSYNGSGQFTDSLGTTPLSISGTPPTNTTLNFTNPSGQQSSYTVEYTEYTIKTAFACSGANKVSEFTATGVYLPTSLELPDGRSYIFAYEQTPGYGSGYTTARLTSITLPTGGVVTYSYTGSNDGIECQDGTIAGLNRTTPDGEWKYSRTVSNGLWTTTVTAPAYQGVVNQTAITFATANISYVAPSSDYLEVSRQSYAGSAASGTLLQTILTCYNGSSSCPSQTSVTLPIASLQKTTQMGGSTARAFGYSETYNSNGQLTEHTDYKFGASGSVGSALRSTIISYASLAGGLSMPSEVEVEDGNNTVYSETQYAYDQTAVQQTTGTPEHVSGTNAGNLTTFTQCLSSACTGSNALTSTFTYFDTGNLQTANDVNAAQTTLAYGSCGNSFPTQVNYPVDGLTIKATWNCTGGVQLTSVDPNSNTTTYAYNDPNYWRVTTTTDPWGNQTNQTYPTGTGTDNTSEEVLVFNGGAGSNTSATDLLTAYDSIGRVQYSQQREAPGSTTFDTTETKYNSLGLVSQSSIPYAGALASPPTTFYGTTTTYDALQRIIKTSDGGGGTFTYGWDPMAAGNQNDLLITVGPAPTGENTKQRQLEYDAVGRLASVCEVTSMTGSGSCGGTGGQETAYNGYLTEYTYDPADRLTEVQQNVQPNGTVQQRLVSYDWLGRKTKETIPETGITYYTYDSDATCGTYKGDLVKIQDAVGNITCMTYDQMHRPTSAIVNSGGYKSVTQQVHYAYDSASVNGVAMQNVEGALAEAWTCTGSCSSRTTDEGFTYYPETSGGSDTGRLVAQVYESTPHSTHYYVTQDTYYPNGAIGATSASLNGSSITGLPTASFNLDGEGRAQTAFDGTYNLVSAMSYDPASYPTAITLGNGDADSFTYGTSTYRPTQFKYNVVGSSPFSITGNLTWNQNWSLQQLQLTDTNDSTKSQTCTYSADDLQRLASVNCSSAWEQTFTYDPFGNITKTANPGPGQGYLAGYSALTNRVNSGVVATYDANGNQTQNTWAIFAWNAANQPVTVNGISATYDALGRMVETENGSAYAEYIYRPSGDKLAILNGGTLVKSVFPLPGGGSAVYSSTGLEFIRHKDWLGNSRLATTWAHGIYSKEAYAPFGEPYNEAGTQDRSFTGQDPDTTQGIYDFMFRRYDSTAGRWLSPDPAGWEVVDQTDPQSFDRYAYVENDPMSFVDPLGLTCYISSDGTLQDDGDGQGCTDPTTGVTFYCTPAWACGGPVPTYQVTVTLTCGQDPDCMGFLYPSQSSYNPTLPEMSASNGGTSWYHNSCITRALGAGALSVGFDAIGLIPEAGGVARMIGHQAGYVGVVADQTGARIIKAAGSSTSTVSGLNGLFDTSPQGLISSGLTIAGFIPGLGQLAAGASIMKDAITTAIVISKCP